MNGVVTTTILARLRPADALRANANALIVSTAVTSAAGLAFWALAARWLPADAVGIGTALVSVLTLLANLATLGLRNGLVRFLPQAGTSTRRLMTGSSLACVGAAVVLAGVFLVGQPWWAGELGLLRADFVTVAVFVASTAVWVLFVLQDHMLIGLRKSSWVPVKNLAYSLAKIAVLPLLTAAATWAVFGATVLPAVAAVAGVALLLWRFAGTAEETPAGGERISVRQLARFAAADQVAWMVWVATPHVLTLIVLHLRGPEASAYYYMANMIGYSLYLITSNIGSALIAESAHDPRSQAGHARAALVHSVRLVLPLAVVGVIAAPFALRILGGDYADHATTATQLIILSALPQMIVGISVNTARVRREMSTVVVTYVFLAVTIWGGSWVTLQWWGVSGVGATVLVAQSLAAIGLVATGRTGLTPTGRAAVTGRVGETASAVVSGLSRTLRHGLDHRERRRRLDPALVALGLADVRQMRTLASDSDTLVTAVTTPTEEFVLKIATTAASHQNVTRHADVVTALRDRVDADFAALLPRVLDRATVGERVVLRETLRPGSSVGDPGTAAAAAIAPLHAATARATVVTPALLEQWVEAPVAGLHGLATGDRYRPEVDRIARYLREGLDGRTVTVSRVHGDYWPGNVLVTDDDDATVVSGIVDWENSMDPGLPDVDTVHWYLSVSRLGLGDAVCSVLDNPAQLDQFFAKIGVDRPNPELGPELVVVFTWLWHVANTRARATRHGPGRIWYGRSVLPVLRRFRSAEPSAARRIDARHP